MIPMKNTSHQQAIFDYRSCFQFKASFSSFTILQLLHHNLDLFAQELNKLTEKMPNFFANAMIVIDLEKITEQMDFKQLKQILIDHQMIPIGVQNAKIAATLHEATEAGLPALSLNSATNNRNAQHNFIELKQHTKLIQHPVRSGMQIYAKNSDLVITAAVSEGAEIMADGHIHVYGPLRGRALAGVKGDKEARIFCHQFRAELVSIAGYYLTQEDMPKRGKQNGMIQIYLENNQVKITTIE